MFDTRAGVRGRDVSKRFTEINFEKPLKKCNHNKIVLYNISWYRTAGRRKHR